jgi:hypothetical protein
VNIVFFSNLNTSNDINRKEAGAELCQAQEKLGLAKPSLPSKRLASI